jgi:hypothetical protein
VAQTEDDGGPTATDPTRPITSDDDVLPDEPTPDDPPADDPPADEPAVDDPPPEVPQADGVAVDRHAVAPGGADEPSVDGAVAEGPPAGGLVADPPPTEGNALVGRSTGGRARPLTREVDVDRDRADFSAVTTFLRRRGVIGPPRPEAPLIVPSPTGQPSTTEDERPGTLVPLVDPDGARELLRQLRTDRRTMRRYLPPVVMVALIGAVCLAHHLPGVDWGDDFALYMRQAKGLALGNIGEVIGANRFAVENSGWSTFSPYSYPWGWPLLVAPVYALFGLDYETVKLLEVAAFCIFLLCFYAIVKRRTGALGATVLTLLVGLSPSFVGATDTVLSDIPFLCFVGVSLWWLDRCRERGILEERPIRLVILGLLMAYTFNIRREGISVVVALIALHLAVVGSKALRAQAGQALAGINWRPVALPYITFLGAAAAFHLILPTVLRPTATGTGLSNIPHRFKYHRDVLAEHVGLKDFGLPVQLLGSERAGRNALTVLLVLAVVGMVARLLIRHQEDITLAAYFCSASFVVLVSPYQESRYLFTITPLLAYFAYQSIPAVAELLAPSARRVARAGTLGAAIAVAGLVLINAADLKHTLDYRRVYDPVVNGPEAPEAEQMFTAVKTLTRGDDVILFFRARAMTLYTDRLAVQGSDLTLMLPRSDWYVMAKGSTYSQTLLTDAEGSGLGLTKAWENPGWVIWRVPARTA